jgi:HTH-type transcriptional regulator, sugar sensing transcriptional regulator
MFKELRNFGLSEKEAKVYVATLELGKATAQDIAKKANVNRATTYVQLESLKDRGLVSQTSTDKKTFFIAEPPENVQKLIEKEKLDVLFKEKEFNKLLPNLQAIYNVTEDRPRVRFYEGTTGVAFFCDQFLKNYHAWMNVIVPIDNFQIREGFYDQIKCTKEYNMIYVAGKVFSDLEALQEKYKNFNVKRIAKDKLELKMEIVITPSGLWMYKFDGSMGIFIEDKIYTNSFNEIFKLLWQIAS